MRMLYRLSIILCVLLINLQAFSQRKKRKEWEFSGHLSIGLNIPLKAEQIPENPAFINIASQSVSNPGFELAGAAYYKQIGFNLGFGHYKYLLNSDKFEDDIKEQNPIDSVSIYMSEMVRDIPVFAGLSYYFKIKDFYIEPEFLVRYNKTIGPYYADIYFWDDNGLAKSVNYVKKGSSRFDLVPGLRLSYFYTLNAWQKVGIQFSYHYSMSNPEIEYRKTEADLIGRTVYEVAEKTTVSYATSNFSFGLILRFK